MCAGRGGCRGISWMASWTSGVSGGQSVGDGLKGLPVAAADPPQEPQHRWVGPQSPALQVRPEGRLPLRRVVQPEQRPERPQITGGVGRVLGDTAIARK